MPFFLSVNNSNNGFVQIAKNFGRNPSLKSLKIRFRKQPGKQYCTKVSAGQKSATKKRVQVGTLYYYKSKKKTLYLFKVVKGSIKRYFTIIRKIRNYTRLSPMFGFNFCFVEKSMANHQFLYLFQLLGFLGTYGSVHLTPNPPISSYSWVLLFRPNRRRVIQRP